MWGVRAAAALRLAQQRSTSAFQQPSFLGLFSTDLHGEPTTEAAPQVAPEVVVAATQVPVSEAAADGDSGANLGFPEPADLQAPAAATPRAPPGPKKIYARLSNAPKYAFKSDILWFFEGCNLTPDQLVTIYDEKYRQRFLQVEFDSMESFRLAQRVLVRKGRLGGRYMKLDVDMRLDVDDIHTSVKGFRGQSLLMMQLPTDATSEDVERFFQGYNLAGYSTKFLRVPKETFPKKPSKMSVPPVVERRALVKFATPLESLRALREKQGQFCLDRAIELRFIQ